MEYSKLFKMPTPMKITGRSSSITNSFVNSIIPNIKPEEEEIKQALDILGMTPDTYQCAYCGSQASEWDHLRPLVEGKMPTGYISEIRNLVPCCGKCNQSKGNKAWTDWITSSADLSPKTRGIQDIEDRIKRLTEYENWGSPVRVNIEEIVGSALWKQHWANCERIQSMMRESQVLAEEINQIIKKAYKD
jgi:hypothetical protein